MLQIASNCRYLDKPCDFFFDGAPNPNFCVPSQFVSWSAQPLEPPSETYVSALHDKCSPFLGRENLFWIILVNVLASDAPTFFYLFNEVFYYKKCHICQHCPYTAHYQRLEGWQMLPRTAVSISLSTSSSTSLSACHKAWQPTHLDAQRGSARRFRTCGGACPAG